MIYRMNEQTACVLLGLEPGATLEHIERAWQCSNKSRKAAEAARFLQGLARADILIARAPAISSWADDSDISDAASRGPGA